MRASSVRPIPRERMSPWSRFEVVMENYQSGYVRRLAEAAYGSARVIGAGDTARKNEPMEPV